MKTEIIFYDFFEYLFYVQSSDFLLPIQGQIYHGCNIHDTHQTYINWGIKTFEIEHHCMYLQLLGKLTFV